MEAVFVMTTCSTVSKDMLVNPVSMHINETLDFETARLVADQKAKEMANDPMMLGWYEAKSGKFSPNVECCSEHKPGWIVYAESRGANITIDINNEAYIFIYRDFDHT
jgi:hypothetical protein